MSNAILYFLCGKMGAGKSTYSRKLAARDTTVLTSEDEWLAKLYPDLISTFDDYRKYSALLKPVVFDHVVNLLQSGCNVVLDFPANTVKQREWFTDIARTAKVDSLLTYIEASDEQCIKNLAQRNVEEPERVQFDNEKVFHEVTKFFQEPEEQEKLNINRV